MTTPIGIDLGTTFSVVACVPADDARPSVIPNEQGHAITPSVVAFVDGRFVVGDDAKDRLGNGYAAAAFFKRAMGDPDFALELGGRRLTAIGLSALVLSHLREQATRHLNESVTCAVITVPAYFTNLRREATMEAGREAGLDVLSIISEPTAAARAFGLRPGASGTVLVYDLGGGTFDVSLVRITDSELRVIGTGGDHNLGGKDWDDRLLLWAADQFDREFGGEILGSSRDDLLLEAEKVKRALSARESTSFVIRDDKTVAQYPLTRAIFADLTRDLLVRTRALSEQVLDEAGVRWADLAGVVPVGGSSRMPMVRLLLSEMSGREPLAGAQPDEAVALGAALQAADDLIAREPAAPRLFLSASRRVIDVMSHSLGMIAVSADETRYVNSVLVKKNQPLPAEQTKRFTLSPRGQRTRLEVFLTQGEGADPTTCEYLGRYEFDGFEDSTSGEVDVTYGYDRNGVVQVRAAGLPGSRPLRVSVSPVPDDVPARFMGAPPKAQPLTVYLVFDVSGSMEGSPLEEARKAARAFVSECDLQTAQIGIMAVSDSATMVLEASRDDRQIDAALTRLSAGMTGWGNGAHPFEIVHSALRRVDGRRYAVVLADGAWSDQPTAVRRARDCHAEGIEVIGVGFGGADRSFLREISSTDEGVFTDLRGLTDAFSSIARELTDAGASTRLRAPR